MTKLSLPELIIYRDHTFWFKPDLWVDEEYFDFIEETNDIPDKRKLCPLKRLCDWLEMFHAYSNRRPLENVKQTLDQMSRVLTREEAYKYFHIKTSLARNTVVFQCQPEDQWSPEAEKLVASGDIAHQISRQLLEINASMEFHWVLHAMLKDVKVQFYREPGVFELAYTAFTQVAEFEDLDGLCVNLVYEFLNEHHFTVKDKAGGTARFQCKPIIPHSPEKVWIAYKVTYNIEKVGPCINDLVSALTLYAPDAFTEFVVLGDPVLSKRPPVSDDTCGWPIYNPSGSSLHSPSKYEAFVLICLDRGEYPPTDHQDPEFGSMNLACSEYYPLSDFEA